ncbi:MAG: hypothetical protein QM640_16905 [Niabella sp.]
MKFSQEDFQKTRRISSAIQQFLIQTGMKDARTTDVYETLTRKGLIEKDRYHGLHFRNFLRQLKDANLLHLIPQCSSNTGTRGNEWYFNPVPNSSSKPVNIIKQASVHHRPAMSKDEIALLINEEREHVEKLPVRTDKKYTIQELEIKQHYPRAYEIWTNEEYEILKKVFIQCKNVEAISLLLKRQPHIVKEKIESLQLAGDKS